MAIAPMIPTIESNRSVYEGIVVAYSLVKNVTQKIVDFKESLEGTETFIKVVDVSTSVINLFARIDPILKITFVVKRLKGFISYLKGGISINELLRICRLRWWEVLYNILGLATAFFYTLDYVMKIKNVATFVHRALARVPFLGVLPFGGLLTLLTISTSGIEVYKEYIKYKISVVTKERIKDKIKYWKAATDLGAIIAEKLAKMNLKVEKFKGDDGAIHLVVEKKEQWEQIQSESKKSIKVFQFELWKKEKQAKWNTRLKKVNTQYTTHILVLSQKIMKIFFSVMMSALYLTLAGAWFTPFIATGVSIIEVSMDVAKYYLKRKISHIGATVNKAAFPEERITHEIKEEDLVVSDNKY